MKSHNAGSRNIEEQFEELLRLSRSLSEEQQRHVRWGRQADGFMVETLASRG